MTQPAGLGHQAGLLPRLALAGVRSVERKRARAKDHASAVPRASDETTYADLWAKGLMHATIKSGHVQAVGRIKGYRLERVTGVDAYVTAGLYLGYVRYQKSRPCRMSSG